MQMKSEVVLVDPVLAALWLAKNYASNRPMRPGTVKSYAELMKAGEWQLTHQGVAFDAAGVLIDGQHRLAAVVEAGATVPMMVTVGVPVAAFAATDCGVRRSVGDRLVLSRRLVAVLTAADAVANGRKRIARPTQIRAIADSQFGRTAAALLETNGTQKRAMSSSWVGLAATVAVLEGQDFEWVAEQRRVLVCQDEDCETPVARCFRRRFQNFHCSADPYPNMEILAAALLVFDRFEISTKLIKLLGEWREDTRVRVSTALNEGT